MGNSRERAAGNIGMKLKRYPPLGLCLLALLTAVSCGFPGSTAVSTPTATVQPSDEAVPVFEVQPSQSAPEAEPSAVAAHVGPAPLAVLNQQYATYGSITIEGMRRSDYDAAMSAVWTEVDTPGEPVPYDIDLSESMGEAALEEYILNLGRYDGVDISVIGHSELGRNLYMVTLNLGGGNIGDKPLLLLTGGVHAREFAGPEYAVKVLSDTLAKAQTDEETRALLESVIVVAVPLVNPDGRALILDGGDKSRKSNAHGVDLNRAMPSVNAGQLAAGVDLVENFSTVPGMDFFAGYRLGTESETQAVIKWLETYVPDATAYIDLHQQGGVIFYDKAFTSAASDEACLAFAESMDDLLGGGYELREESRHYSLDGDGGTLTDYARSISEGFLYSDRLGRRALLADSEELPLISFRDIDSCMEYYQPVNADFQCISIEIGRKRSYLGPGEGACERRASEYERYGWEDFLTGTIEILTDKE